MKKIQHIWQAVTKSISQNFKPATITFLLIMLVVNGFQLLFGSENMVLGIIIAPMMLVLAERDMTAHPVRHFMCQALILCIMASAACFAMLVPAPFALFIHLAVAFFLLYLYTSDCGDHMYFQYILNYLLLIFIGPISLPQLPLRLLGMVVGAGCILLYQCVKRRGRVNKVTRDVLLCLLEDTKSQMEALLCDSEAPGADAKFDNALKTFYQTMEHRQKAPLGLSEAGIAAMEIVHSLKKLNSVLRSGGFIITAKKRLLLRSMLAWVDDIHTFILEEKKDIPQFQPEMSADNACDVEQFYQYTIQMQRAFSALLCSQKRRSFCKTDISIWSRMKLAANFSPMRVAYALRLACLLSVGILLVQRFDLEHGKWLLFTIASVSLPYSEEIGPKAKNRFFATLIGGLAGLVIFPLIPSPTGKMVAMVASGYLSCYMTNYLGNFSCSTFGALGGAVVAMTATGFAPVGGMVLIRIGYIVAGILIAIVLNCFVFPINQKRATRHLAKKYTQATQALAESYRNCQPDLQLHYHLLLRTQRMEEKLRQNAKAVGWDDVQLFLLNCQANIWKAQQASV